MLAAAFGLLDTFDWSILVDFGNINLIKDLLHLNWTINTRGGSTLLFWHKVFNQIMEEQDNGQKTDY